MLACKQDAQNASVVIDIVESAPFNNPHNLRNKSRIKEYDGVGGHLFAEACRQSYEYGYYGFVYFKAKTNLIEYYQKTLGTKLVNNGDRIMAIEVSEAIVLLNKYYGGDE